jgi:NDP-sugar pyrophosphorylase family protein
MLYDIVRKDFIPEIDNYSILFKDSRVIDVLNNIGNLIVHLSKMESAFLSTEPKFKHESAYIHNCLFGKNVEIYEGCSIRDSIIFDNSTIGHCSEIARSIILKGCMIPRFNYVGGSLIGERTRLGGCVSLATRRHDNKNIEIIIGNIAYNTYNNKFGSIVGSDVLIGFASHLNPGCCVGKNTIVSPYSDLRISIPSNSIVQITQKVKIIPNKAIPKTVVE